MNKILEVKNLTRETIVYKDKIYFKEKSSPKGKEIKISDIVSVERKNDNILLINDGKDIYEVFLGVYLSDTELFLNNDIAEDEFIKKSHNTGNIILVKTIIMLPIIILLFYFIFGWLFGGSDEEIKKEIKTPITQTQVINIKKEMNEWGKSRWDNWQVGINGEDNTSVIMRVYANSYSNDVAIDGYCGVLRSIALSNNIDEEHRHIYIYQNGKNKKYCK